MWGFKLAGTTGLEPAASCVTGMRSNQLNYVPGMGWSCEGLTISPGAEAATRRRGGKFSRRVRHWKSHVEIPPLILMVGGIRLERMTFCL